MSGTLVGEGEVVVFRQDDVVYEGDVHHSAGRADAFGLFDVTLAGSGIAGRMVVSHFGSPAIFRVRLSEDSTQAIHEERQI